MDVPEWNPDGPVLIYQALARHLAARIRAGEWRIGDRIPPERDLAAEYGVAHPTVRRAVETLRERGILRTIHGKGTYVVAVPAGDE